MLLPISRLKQTVILAIGIGLALVACAPPLLVKSPPDCPGGVTVVHNLAGTEILQQPFSALFSPQIPHDVHKDLLQQAHCAQNDQQVKALYDLLSWQTFMAINWPVDEQGQAYAFGDESGVPQWLTWKESEEVFRADGAAPEPWGSARALPETFGAARGLSARGENLDRQTRILYKNDKLQNLLDVQRQIAGHPLWDQNGNKVYYEILLNQSVFQTVTSPDAPLYNLDGQIAYWDQIHHQLGNIFASGIYNYSNFVGAIEIKLAWKIIDQSKGDIPERFFRMDAMLLDDTGDWGVQEVGLVGMHINHKTQSAEQWVWSTFEHMDNLAVDPQAVAVYAKQGKSLKPSFFDPNCKTAAGGPCPANVLPTPDAMGVLRTQVIRELPIPAAVENLNAYFQKLFREKQSVWQYYRLINTQYPTTKVGDPTPTLMTNPVIETYDQQESCMACHAQAELASGGDPTTGPIFTAAAADFSWSLRNAQWRQTAPSTE